MRDQISILRVNELHPAIRTDVIQGIESSELALGPYACVRVTQSGRTFEESDFLYKIGRTIKGANAGPGKPMGDKVTNSKAGQSFHNYLLAFDFAIMYDKDKNGTFESLSWDLVKDMDRDGEADWKEVVDVFKALGFEWGGDWKSIKDSPHIQKTFGNTWQMLLQKYNAGKLIPGTKFVIL